MNEANDALSKQVARSVQVQALVAQRTSRLGSGTSTIFIGYPPQPGSGASPWMNACACATSSGQPSGQL